MNVQTTLITYGIDRQREIGRLQKTASQRAVPTGCMGGGGTECYMEDTARCTAEVPESELAGQTASDLQLLRQSVPPISKDSIQTGHRSGERDRNAQGIRQVGHRIKNLWTTSK